MISEVKKDGSILSTTYNFLTDVNIVEYAKKDISYLFSFLKSNIGEAYHMSESAVGHDRYDLKIFVRGKQPNNEG